MVVVSDRSSQMSQGEWCWRWLRSKMPVLTARQRAFNATAQAMSFGVSPMTMI